MIENLVAGASPALCRVHTVQLWRKFTCFPDICKTLTLSPSSPVVRPVKRAAKRMIACKQLPVPPHVRRGGTMFGRRLLPVRRSGDGCPPFETFHTSAVASSGPLRAPRAGVAVIRTGPGPQPPPGAERPAATRRFEVPTPVRRLGCAGPAAPRVDASSGLFGGWAAGGGRRAANYYGRPAELRTPTQECKPCPVLRRAGGGRRDDGQTPPD